MQVRNAKYFQYIWFLAEFSCQPCSCQRHPVFKLKFFMFFISFLAFCLSWEYYIFGIFNINCATRQAFGILHLSRVHILLLLLSIHLKCFRFCMFQLNTMVLAQSEIMVLAEWYILWSVVMFKIYNRVIFSHSKTN